MRKVLYAIIVSVLAFGGIAFAAPAQAATCTISIGQNCGPYDYPAIPMSNGYDTYVSNQAVNVQSGSTQTITATDPGNWSMVANDQPYGYTGVQTFAAVQQLTNDWNGSGWGGGSSDTPLSQLSSLTVTYNETSPHDANSIYEFAPDVWDTAAANDVMFWADTSPTRCTDNGLTSADIYGQAVLGGQNWTVYHYGTEVIFILDGSTSTDPVSTGTCAQQASGTIDILGGYQWLVAHGVQSSLGNLTQLNTGWEMTSADNTTFTMNSYSINATVGSQQAQAPAVTTNAAANVTNTSATLNGTVNPEGQATTYQYQFGTDTNYGTNVPASPASAGSGTSAVSEPQNMTGLLPSTTYHYRLVATNATGTTNGADRTFTTAATAPQPPPVPTGLSTSNITQHAATAHWASEPGATSFHLVLWKTATGVVVRDRIPVAGATSWHWTQLAKNTSFTWHISATNANGTSAYSQNVTFKTLP